MKCDAVSKIPARLRPRRYGNVVSMLSLNASVGFCMSTPCRKPPASSISESIETTLPYLRGRSLAGILLTASHFIFAYHFGLMLLGLGRTSTVPTFLNPVEAEASGGH